MLIVLLMATCKQISISPSTLNAECCTLMLELVVLIHELAPLMGIVDWIRSADNHYWIWPVAK